MSVCSTAHKTQCAPSILEKVLEKSRAPLAHTAHKLSYLSTTFLLFGCFSCRCFYVLHLCVAEAFCSHILGRIKEFLEIYVEKDRFTSLNQQIIFSICGCISLSLSPFSSLFSSLVIFKTIF